MRVLFASYQSVANPGGGVFTQIMKTREYLQTMGVEVELFNQWKRYDYSNIDIIHVFETDMRNYFLLRSLPSSIPLIVSPIIDKNYPPIAARFFTYISTLFPPQVITSYKSHSFSFKKAQIIIARSTQERIMLNRGFGVKHNKIRMVPNGVDEKFIYGGSKLFCSKYGFKNFVLYVGQIGNPRKNLLRLIKVAKFLKDIEFVLIGPILETPYAQRVISAAKDLNNVYILGRVPEEELISAYAACKVFILPSLIEGTGLVALEAGLAGANIVVTNRGGTIDYFKDYAIMIDPTTKGILQGIKEALRRPSNPKQREIILNNFTWKIVARKLLSIYKEFS